MLALGNIYQQHKITRQRLEEITRTTSLTIKKSLQKAMVNNKPDEVRDILNALKDVSGIKELQIIDLNGNPRFIDEVDYNNKKINKNFINKRGDFYFQGGELIYSVIDPIYNLSVCYKCHGNKKPILGYLSVKISSFHLIESFKKNIFSTIIFTLISVFIISLGLILLLNKIIYSPIMKISKTMTEVKKGNLSSRVKVYQKDELGKLALNLNQMLDTIEKDQEKIQKMQSRLIQIQKLAAIGRLTAGLSHEINTPLTSILTCADQMLEKEEREKEKRYLEIIKKEILRIIEIAKQIKEFSPQYKEELEELDLNNLLTEIKEQILPRFEMNNIKIFLKAFPSLPLILANSPQIKQVLLNLIENAFDAMPQGGELILKTSLENIENKGENNISGKLIKQKAVIIKIKDTGCGIPKEIQAKIFEPFFTTKEVGEGAGLGLFICYNIMKAHLGEIFVESEINKGTTFIIKFPIFEEI